MQNHFFPFLSAFWMIAKKIPLNACYFPDCKLTNFGWTFALLKPIHELSNSNDFVHCTYVSARVFIQLNISVCTVSDLTDLLTIMVQENILSQGATYEIELHKTANDSRPWNTYSLYVPYLDLAHWRQLWRREFWMFANHKCVLICLQGRLPHPTHI